MKKSQSSSFIFVSSTFFHSVAHQPDKLVVVQFLIWSNIKTSEKNAVTVTFFANFENQFSTILVSELFFETYSISLAPVSRFQVGGLGLCNPPNKPAINNWEVTVQVT
jgi:hypothetical protein